MQFIYEFIVNNLSPCSKKYPFALNRGFWFPHIDQNSSLGSSCTFLYKFWLMRLPPPHPPALSWNFQQSPWDEYMCEYDLVIKNTLCFIGKTIIIVF